MSLHVIIGAGPVGSAAALRLAAAGHQVRVITRSGTGPDADGIEKISADAADAADAGQLARLAAGSAVIYNCASPPYHRWPQDWPPLAASVLAGAGAAHSWTYVPGIAAALITLGAHERAWGRAWHVPTSAPMSQRGIFTALARIAGAPAPRLRPVPPWLLRAAGLAVPSLRELGEVAYQFTGPFVMDSAAFRDTFGTGPTPADQALAATVAWWQHNGRTAASKE